MDKAKIIIILLCFFLLGTPVLSHSFKSVLQQQWYSSIDKSYLAQGQTTTDDDDEDDEDDDENDEDDEDDD